MGFLDPKPLTPAAADARYATAAAVTEAVSPVAALSLFERSAAPNTLASIGDSIACNGAWGMAMVKLTAPAAAGATTISISTAEAQGVTMSADFEANTIIRVGEEYAVVTAYSGTGPTLTLAAGLASSKPVNTEVYGVRTLFSGQASAIGGACILSGGRLRYAGNWGHGGYTVEQMQRLYLPKVIAAKPGYCYVMAGRNRYTPEDIYGNAARVVKIWDDLLAAGITPVASTIPPVTSATAAARAEDEILNDIIRTQARKRGIPFDDFHARVVDPATGNYLSTVQNGADNTHPNEYGRQLQAQGIWEAINGTLSARAVPTHPLNGYNVTSTIRPFEASRLNARMLTAGGTVFGTGTTSVIPLKWIAGIPGAEGQAITVAAPDGVGNAIKIERKAGHANVTAIETSPAAALVTGNRYRVRFSLKTNGVTAAATADAAFGGIKLWLGDNSNGLKPLFTWHTQKRDVDGTFEFDVVVPPGLSTTGIFGVRLLGSAATPAYDVTVWNFEFLNLGAIQQATDSPWPYQGTV